MTSIFLQPAYDMGKLIITIIGVLISYMVASSAEIAKYKDDKLAAVSLTFDDGLLEHYTIVFPELEKRNLKGTFCVNGSKISIASTGKENDRMKWSMLREMAESGHEITNHGWAHLKVWRLNEEELRYEVQHNDTAIYQNTGQFPRTYVFPGNSKTDSAINFCSKDRVGLRMKQIALGGKRDMSDLQMRIKKAIASRDAIVGMTHGISRGYDCFESVDKFIDMLDRLLCYRDSVWICTFQELSSYEALRMNTRLTEHTDKDKRLKRIDVKCDLSQAIYNCRLTMKVAKNGINIDNLTIMQDGKPLQYSSTESSILFDFNPHGSHITFHDDLP